ncbi:MAG: ABC transporter permease, partial [Bacteroidota bacterium]|nr:ABC transporter permease [Bacteroidota bacterium]
YVDTRYLETLKIKPVAGRIFSTNYPEDTSGTIILNQTASKTLGFATPQDAVDKNLHFDFNHKTYDFKIIGVVQDFHFQDLHLPIGPYGFRLNTPPLYNYLIVHLQRGNVDADIKSITGIWHRLNQDEPFDYSFLDKDFDNNYKAEIRLSAIVGYFTAIAILISCLGLFGLSTFSSEQRKKEIGVRKVLGASVPTIVTLLSGDFLKLVLISVVIATPIAWLVMKNWLQGFAYRVQINFWIFLLTGIGVAMIAFLTISYQAIKAAVAIPIESLRTE